MTDPDIVRRRFNQLREFTDPRAHDLLDELEELCTYVVESHRTIAGYIAELEHERRVSEAIHRLVAYPPRLRGVS